MIVHPVGNDQVYVTPATLVTEYVCEVPAQGLAAPVIAEGCATAGSGVTLSVWAVPFPHPVDGVTVTVPAVAEGVIVTELVPCPAVTDQPAGNDHVYVTPATLVTE